VIALARIGDLACGLILKVRGGRVLGKEHHVLRNLTASGSDPAEALGLFVTRWYLRGTDFPPEVLIPFDFEDRPLVEAWLAAHATRAVRVRVPRRGAKRKLVELAERNAFLLLEEETLRGAADAERAADVVRALQRELGLPRLPRSVACFDVSTLQGADPVGACVVFENGSPRKSEYRRFRIRYVEGQDDFAMIAEIVGRWLRGRLEGGEDLPDLLVVDGGKGQLGSALGVLAELGVEDVPVVALAKQDEEIYVAGRTEPLVLPRRSEALRLLQRARDEAHRFAVAYHRHRRAARTLVSGVDEIPGVGARRRRALLSRFGSVDRLRAARPDEIAELPGFSLRTAERILAHLRGGAPPASEAAPPERAEGTPSRDAVAPRETGRPASGAEPGSRGIPAHGAPPHADGGEPLEPALEPAFDGMGRPL
jgi:excinuclease ABC subunit C